MADLYTVNTSTGAETLVGAIGSGSAGDLAFNGGNLYLSSTSNELIRVNVSTGAGTDVGPLGVANIFGLATGSDGVLYGISGKRMYSIDTTSGAATLLRSYGTGLSDDNGATAFTAVPEPSSMALCGIAGLLGSGYAWRRRGKANG